ncbi:MAG: hypothetical protein N2Z71_10030 [Caloramator sp.]|nr:hypothetical protein [Caloramator sp.]
MYRASKNAKIESLILIMFGVSIGIFPLFSGKAISIEAILTAILVVALGIYMYKRVIRLKVVIYNDRIEYFGESKKSDRVIYFNNIYLVETVNKSGAFLTFIVDKYKEGGRWIIRGTYPEATEKEMGRDKDIKLDFKKSLCIDSRKIENSREIVETICSKISKNRVGEGAEKYIKGIKEENNDEVQDFKFSNLIYKIIMSINLIGLLIVLMILEGKSPILRNVYFRITTLIVFLINGVFSMYLRIKYKNNKNYKIIFNIGIIISALIISLMFI